jgi:hypothetical protein
MSATQSTRFVKSARHPVNIGHLVMGIAFLGLVGVWTLVQTDVVDGGDVRWLLPVPWVLAGLAGLLATTVTGKRRYAHAQSGWVDTRDPYDGPGYDPDPNRDLDEKIAAAARERQTARTSESDPADSPDRADSAETTDSVEATEELAVDDGEREDEDEDDDNTAI